MSNKMTDEVKARLRENQQKQRSVIKKAKDYAIADWIVAIDMARDWLPANCHGPADPHLVEDYFERRFKRLNEGGAANLEVGRTFRFIKPEVINALCERLPHIWIRYQSGPNRARTTAVFPSTFAWALLKALELNTMRYSSAWSVGNLHRAIVNRPEGGAK